MRSSSSLSTSASEDDKKRPSKNKDVFLTSFGPLLPLDVWRPFPLLSKETLTNGSEHGAPIKRFTFGLPEHTTLQNMNTSIGMRLKVKMPAGTLATGVKGNKPRSYTPTSPSGQLGSFDLTVKIYPQGCCSRYLDSVAIGESVLMSGPYVPYESMVRQNPGERVGVVALGVGITYGLAIVRGQLAQPASAVRQVRLVYVNRGPEDVVFHRELQELAKQHLNRFSLVYVFSRGSVGSGSVGSGSAAAASLALPTTTTTTTTTTTATTKVATIPSPPPSSSSSSSSISSSLFAEGHGAAPLLGRPTLEMLTRMFADWGDEGKEKNRFQCIGTKEQMKDLYRMLEQAGYPEEKHRLFKKAEK